MQKKDINQNDAEGRFLINESKSRDLDDIRRRSTKPALKMNPSQIDLLRSEIRINAEENKLNSEDSVNIELSNLNGRLFKGNTNLCRKFRE